ncbi:MAG: hypothetical protein JW715_05880 [Sedimentisphaerales bacterium]|nr:hypothetical protein [Sedimentisphaerales bacterium]
MRIVILCLTLILLCSCRQEDPNTASAENEITRHDEISKILYEDFVRNLESYKDRKYGIKFDENYDGTGNEIRGPFTKEQLEKELILLLKELNPELPLNYELKEGSGYYEFLNKYRNGDEFYHFKSDETTWANSCGIEGYVLIRENKILDKVIIRIN